MRGMKTMLAAFAVLSGSRPVLRPAPSVAAARIAKAPLILVSIDGFRWDYLNRGVSPNLSALAAGGVRAERMLPSFPVDHLPQPLHPGHRAGPRPPRHRQQHFEDANLPGVFHMTTKDEAWWRQGTPIWVTAEQQGVRTATEFWPGSEVAIPRRAPRTLGGRSTRPSPRDERVDTVLGWLDAPAPRGRSS